MARIAPIFSQIFMTEEQVIRRAEFYPATSTYWLLSGAMVFLISIVGIPLLALWLPLGFFFTRRYLAKMECTLTNKTLKVGKGLITRIEKTIPLEKITDMGMVQGPIMRAMNLHRLTVETAGQSGPGALVALTGIVDATEFREAVLKQRDILAAKESATSTPSAPASNQSDQIRLLTDIRDTLQRVEEKLDR